MIFGSCKVSMASDDRGLQAWVETRAPTGRLAAGQEPSSRRLPQGGGRPPCRISWGEGSRLEVSDE